MNKLFLIDGAASTGKSDLMEFVKMQTDYDISSVGKITTRKRRTKEEASTTDLTFMSVSEFNKRLNADIYYAYKYGAKGEEHDYAISKKDLISSFKKHEFTFAIVRSRPTIIKIISELSQYGLIKHVFIQTDEGAAIARMRRDGFTDEEIAFRTNRNKLLWDEEKYFDRNRITITNNSNPQDFHAQIRSMIDTFSTKHEQSDIICINGITTYPLMPSLVGKKAEIVRQLERYPFKKIFLIMKFRKDNKSIYEEIKRVVEEHGFNCVRADSVNWTFISSDTDNFLATLYCCKYGIALFDKPENGADFSPNVAYELGIMHNQQKKCLILKHKSLNKMPFDLISRFFIEYDDGTQICNFLNPWLKTIAIE